MSNRGSPWLGRTAIQLLATQPGKEPLFCTVGPREPLTRAALLMLVHGISRLPVVEGDQVVGMLDERQVLSAIGSGEGSLDLPIAMRMMAGPPVVEGHTPGSDVWNLLVKGDGLVMVRHDGKWKGILTPSDLLRALTMPAAPEFAV